MRSCVTLYRYGITCYSFHTDYCDYFYHHIAIGRFHGSKLASDEYPAVTSHNNQYQPVKPAIVGPSAENTHARPYQLLSAESLPRQFDCPMGLYAPVISQTWTQWGLPRSDSSLAPPATHVPVLSSQVSTRPQRSHWRSLGGSIVTMPPSRRGAVLILVAVILLLASLALCGDRPVPPGFSLRVFTYVQPPV